MKTKSLWLALAALVAVGGLWLGRAAWRVHRQLVTLHVRNAPLADVLRKVEWQAWKKIRAEQNLDARITLNLVNTPLTHALDRIAQQAGAEWSTKYAVYTSTRALKSLEKALAGDGKLEPAGWMRIAPNTPRFPFSLPEEADDLPNPGSGLQVKRLAPAPGAGGNITATEDVIAGQGQPKRVGPGTPAQGRDRGPVTVRIVRKGAAGGTSAIEEIWTPEELLLESGLRPRLGEHAAEVATPAAATETARAVKGRWATYLAFRKSPLGIGFGQLPSSQPGLEHIMIKRGGGSNDQNRVDAQGPPGPGVADFQAIANRENNERFARLTPQQRVQAARQRLAINQK